MKPYLNGIFAYQFTCWLMKRSLHPLIRHLQDQVASWPGTANAVHPMGGREFTLSGKEIGHIHWDGDLDILFNRRLKAVLLDTGLVEQHKWVPKGGWITFSVQSEADLPRARDLLRLSYLQKSGRLRTLSAEEIHQQVAQLVFGPVVAHLI